MNNKTRADRAVSHFKEGYSCSQAVLLSYAEDFGLSKDTALRLASGFGGGMGRTGHRCGAVTGAYMVLGLKYGATSAQDKEAKERAYRKVREFTGQFKARNKTVSCRELLCCDISTPEGLEEARQKGLLMTVCHKLIQDAVEILEEML